MAEPLKNLLDVTTVHAMARHLSRSCHDFRVETFVRMASAGLDDLAFKARAMQLADALQASLPTDFGLAADALEGALAPAGADDFDEPEALQTSEHGLAGWPVWAMAEHIARHGQAQPERALQALHAMTRRFTAEFAIRPFIVNHPALAFGTLARWVHDDSAHVRTTSDADFWREVQASLQMLVGGKDGRSVVMNIAAGVIMVKATPAEQRQVDHYLRAVQVAIERQVMLEAKIVEVRLSRDSQTGINWAAFGKVFGNTQAAIGVAAPGTTLGTTGTLGSADGTVVNPVGSLASGTLGIALACVLLSFLMVSTVRYRTFKDAHVSPKSLAVMGFLVLTGLVVGWVTRPSFVLAVYIAEGTYYRYLKMAFTPLPAAGR